MCRRFKWGKHDSEQDEAYEKLRRAMVEQFNEFYGKDVNDIRSWEKLCDVLGIEPRPDGMEACREVTPRGLNESLDS